MDVFHKEGLTAYDKYFNVVHANTQKAGETAPGAEVVAETIFKAANDTSFKLRYPSGGQAKMLLWLRKLIPTSLFRWIVGSQVEKGAK